MENFKSGKYIKQYAETGYSYKSFLPSKINKPYQWEDVVIGSLLEEASSKLSKLNTYALKTPDIDFFIKMHVAKEATTSSKIEGTRTEMEEMFMEKESIALEKRDDWEEVNNYIKAMNWSIDELSNFPLSVRLIKGAHKKLMSGVRGERKLPGELRKSQNWIGGRNLEDANFIPPASDDISELLSDLEKFWHNDDLKIPHLIKAGISHYQFETIHPFLDGNGRIGRLIIILYLISKGIIDKPVLYLSEFFSRKRQDYFQSLIKVRESNDMDQWLIFFLTGVIETSDKGIDVLDKIVALKDKYTEIIENKVSTRKRDLANKVLLYLFSNPHISVNDLVDVIDITFPTADSILKDLEKIGIVKETTQKKRDRRFELINYFNIFE